MSAAMTPTVDRALTLEAIRARGWRVVLLGPRAKRPHTKTWEITADTDRADAHLEAGGNLGLITDENTGVAVLDPDDLPGWADMVDTLGQPGPPWVITGSGRLHYYIQWTDCLPAKLTWRGKIIGEIQRGPGLQQVVMPPSIHPRTGLAYRWITERLGFLCAPINPVIDPLPSLPGLWLAYLRHEAYEREYRNEHR